jgi:hypothetical protein
MQHFLNFLPLPQGQESSRLQRRTPRFHNRTCQDGGMVECRDLCACGRSVEQQNMTADE